MLLVADAGGSNTRIALVSDRTKPNHLERFNNDDYPSFDALLTAYIADKDLTTLTGCSIAIAGPVTPGAARLTNRNWHFSRPAIAEILRLKSPSGVYLVNDLTALGYALHNITPTQLTTVRSVPDHPPQNHQTVIVGLGTGFNVCVANFDQTRIVVNEAELGHASLPTSVFLMLQGALGQQATKFDTNESLFSGAGLSRLYRLITNGEDKTGPQIMAAFATGRDGPASKTVALFARSMGVAAQQLVYQYLPYGGISYAGSVAHSVLGSAAKTEFLTGLNTPGTLAQHIAMVPVQIITDDAAGLCGAAQFAWRQARHQPPIQTTSA